MRLLDLFCGAGGAAMGYHQSGFEVVGVDIETQKNFPFEFHQADAIDFLVKHGSEFDAIHASPPCQKFSRIASLGKARNGKYPEHADLIEPTRQALKGVGRPYVIENVEGAPLINPILLCGKGFGLKVYRHRRFESSFRIHPREHAPHRDKTPPAGMGKSPKGFISVCGTGGVKGMTQREVLAYWSYAMGIDWMTREELAQAIPPAYTKWIGGQMLAYLRPRPSQPVQEDES